MTASNGSALLLRAQRRSLGIGDLVGVGSLNVLEVVERLLLGVLLEEDPALEPPGESDGGLVLGELADGDGEDPVELLEGALLGLRDEEKDHDEGNDVETGVEAKGTDGVETVEEEGERGTQNGGPEEASGDGEAHTGLTVGQRVDFGRVGEGHGTFTGGVEGAEEEDEEADETSSDVALIFVHEGGETGGEKSPGHLGEGEEEKSTSAELENHVSYDLCAC